MGGVHDGQNDTQNSIYAYKCNLNDNYILSSTVSNVNEVNQYKFSTCSIEAFKKLIFKNANNGFELNLNFYINNESNFEDT